MVEQAGGKAIDPCRLPMARCLHARGTDLSAIDVCRIEIIDGTNDDGHLLIRPVRGTGELPPVKELADTVVQTVVTRSSTAWN